MPAELAATPYYSRTGNTRTIAGELVSALTADVDQIDDRRDRCGVLGYLRCAREALQPSSRTGR